MALKDTEPSLGQNVWPFRKASPPDYGVDAFRKAKELRHFKSNAEFTAELPVIAGFIPEEEQLFIRTCTLLTELDGFTFLSSDSRSALSRSDIQTLRRGLPHYFGVIEEDMRRFGDDVGVSFTSVSRLENFKQNEAIKNLHVDGAFLPVYVTALNNPTRFYRGKARLMEDAPNFTSLDPSGFNKVSPLVDAPIGAIVRLDSLTVHCGPEEIIDKRFFIKSGTTLLYR